MRPSLNAPGRLFSHSELYPGTPEPVAFRSPAPFYVLQKDVNVQQQLDRSLAKRGWVWFCGPQLETRRLA